MPLFRRKSNPEPEPRRAAGSPARPSPQPAAPKNDHADWRSYDLVAGDYARLITPITSTVASALLEFAGAKPGERIVDVGTGTGAAIAFAQKAAGDNGLAVGVDPAANMLRAAAGGRGVAAEVINLPFRNESFDLAMCNFSLAYFTKLDTALFDVRRVLRPGGRLAVATWGAGEDDLSKTWRLLLEDAIGRDILQAGLRDEAPWADKLSDQRTLDGVIRDAGFRPVTIERREFRFEMTRDDYIRALEIEAAGRYARAMLGPALWEPFRQRVQATYAERFPATLIDFRDVLLLRAGRP